MPNKLFSIVVPIYNAEKYLRDCLDSILYQTSQNYDVFMIDDGSKDSSSDIAKEYADKYPDRFNYIRQENKGLGGARNTGLAHCDGEYAIFLDSDDFIAAKTIEGLENFLNCQQIAPDIILTLPYIYNNITRTYLDFYDKFRLSWIFENRPNLNVKKEPFLLSLEASFWRCVWRREFLEREKLEFFEHTAWEDVPPHFELFKHANSIMKYSDAPTFFYRINNSGQITAGSGKSRLDVPKVFGEVLDRAKKEKWPIQERVHIYKVLFDFVDWSISVIDDNYRVEFIKSVHKLYKKISWYDMYKFKRIIKPFGRIFYPSVALKAPCLYRFFLDRNKAEARFQKMKKLKHILKG